MIKSKKAGRRGPDDGAVFRLARLPTPLTYTSLLDSRPGSSACLKRLIEMEEGLRVVRGLHERAVGEASGDAVKCHGFWKPTRKKPPHDCRFVPCSHCSKAEKAGKPICGVCGHAEGCDDDYGGTVPMGPIERCPHSKKLACPVCLSNHDCCFGEEFEEKREKDPLYAPPGWRMTEAGKYEVIDMSKTKPLTSPAERRS